MDLKLIVKKHNQIHFSRRRTISLPVKCQDRGSRPAKRNLSNHTTLGKPQTMDRLLAGPIDEHVTTLMGDLRLVRRR